MPGITSLLYSALRSMETATLSLAVASNNIANQKTPGYAKQRLLVQPSPNEGDRFLTGTGVEAVKIQAVRDRLLESRLRHEVSNKAGDDALHHMLRDIEVLFNDAADTGMLPSLTNFFNSFHSLALEPSSINFREQVRTAADDLTRSFAVRSEELRRIQTLADKNIADDINTINSLAEHIAGLSREIRTQEAGAGNQSADGLRDKRGQLVKELSEFADITEIESSTDYLLSMGNVLLVYGGRTSLVTADTSGASGLVAVKVGSVDVTSTITAGRIHAQQQIRDKFVPDYLGKLDQLAYEITEQVNAIHSVAYDPSGNTGVNFFDPLASATDGARQIKVNSAITADLTKIATAKQAGGTDNEAATDIGNLIHKKVFTGGSMVDQYRSLVYTIGNDTTNAQGKLEEHSTLLHQLENRRDSISGVSVDEETMKILQFQRAYQASANVIRIVDELLQTVLQIGR